MSIYSLFKAGPAQLVLLLFFLTIPSPAWAGPAEPSAHGEQQKILRFEPYTENGSVIGLKLSNVNPDQGFGKIGFIEGDVIRMLNGKPIKKYSQLKQIISGSAKIKAVVERNDETIELEFDGRGEK